MSDLTNTNTTSNFSSVNISSNYGYSESYESTEAASEPQVFNQRRESRKNTSNWIKNW